jgi:hypothetical protein
MLHQREAEGSGGDSRSTSTSLMEGSRSTSANGTRRSSRLHSTAGSSGRSHTISLGEGVVRRCCGGVMCHGSCVDACRAGKPYRAGADGQDCFNGSDSSVAFANQFPAHAGSDGSMPMSIFYESIGRLRTVPEQPPSVSSITIYRGSFAVGRCAGTLCGRMTYVVMPRRGAAMCG